MRQLTPFLLLAVLISYTHSAPQLISFKDGKIGVNFAGYHAGVGIGGGGAGAGGLYAEAGTPYGQAARAGLGGVVNENGDTSGGLYAGATAGGDIKASAGLAGGVTDGQAAGAGYAQAQAGNRYAASGMGGESSVKGSSEYSFSGTKEDVAPIQPIENEVQPLTKAEPELENEIKTKVYVQPETEVVGQPQIQKIIDLAAESSANAETSAAIEGSINSDESVGLSNTYTKQVSYEKNPNFFADIFNIPISTLKAVSSFLGNTAANTNISVQKSASVADSDTASLKHVPPSSSSASSSAHISVETPSASKFIDDIFSIPINTLGAVNQFLQNNVGRKNAQVAEDGSIDQSVVRARRPHGRRRAHKKVIIQEEIPVQTETA